MNSMYKKRSGTTGIRGQLYETKLISLLYFRLLNDTNVEEFNLASNMDEIGAFDDICIKIKIKDVKRPVLVLIQVKHKDNDEKLMSFDDDLVKWSQSMSNIKKKMSSEKNTHHQFGEEKNCFDCVFVLYTNANYNIDSSKEYNNEIAKHLNNLLSTRDIHGFRSLYTESDLQILSEKIVKDEMIILAKRFSKYFCDQAKRSMDIMNDEFIVRYHVILGMSVVKISNIKFDKDKPDIKWRELIIRPEFFYTHDKYLQLLKLHMYEFIFNYYAKLIKKSGLMKSNQKVSIPDSVMEKSVLSRIIDNDQSGNQPQEGHVVQKSMPLPIIDTAKERTVNNVLLGFKLKVPVVFGNLDLTIRGSSKKIENRLEYLTKTVVELCQKPIKNGSYKIITIDETFEEGLLSCNGGLGGIIGNVLVFDKVNKLLKFTDNHELLHRNAKMLYVKLKSKLDNLHEYRWDVKSSRLAKLSFDHTEMSRDFFNDLIVFAKQSNHNEIEEILKREIDVFNNNNSHVSVHTESVFLYYHNEIQKWWLSPQNSTYLTKESDIFKQSINNILKEPQMSGLQNMFHFNKIRNIAYSFTDNTIQFLNTLEKFSKVIITTNVTTLTTMKVVQRLRQNNNSTYAILDTEYIINMATKDFAALKDEITKTEKVAVIVFDTVKNNRNLHRRLDELSEVTEEKNIILIIHNTTVDVVKEYLSWSDDHLITDQQNFNTLTLDCQKDILKNTEIIFKNKRLTLDLLIDDTSMAFINESVLQKIFRNETLIIGDALTNSNYENIKDLYIERRISLAGFETEYEIKSFFDINKDTVLVIAKPGMGKSTLLMHLSLNTKEIDNTVWIVRINLLDYSKKFYKWQKRRIAIDILGTVKFLCQVIIKNKHFKIRLKESKNMIHLEDPAGEKWETFQLNLFLHFFNKGRTILLFDGFDEICPHYMDCLLEFFHVLLKVINKNKMWVTSRPNSDIVPRLVKILGNPYEMGYLNDIEQESYLLKIWENKLEFDKLNNIQLDNAISYMNYIKNEHTKIKMSDALNNKFLRIHRLFYNYIYENLRIETHIFVVKSKSAKAMHTHEYKHQLFESAFIDQSEKKIYRQNLESADSLFGTPLLLYLLADYFVNLILEKENKRSWELNINIHSIYEMFIVTKLKTILFKEKNKMDVYNPQIMMAYEKEREDCLDRHKKIAAYILLGRPFFSGLDLEELKDMVPLIDEGLHSYDDMMNSIRNGTEKTGIISYVPADNVPVFIHRTFLEYFVAEYLCDIFKSDKFIFDNKRLLYTTINIWHNDDIFPWIKKKRHIDRELSDIILDITSNLPACTSVSFSGLLQILIHYDWSLEQHIRIMTSTPDDYLGEVEDIRTKEVMIARMKPHLRKYFTDCHDHRDHCCQIVTKFLNSFLYLKSQ